jgi:hypothetical protein
MQVIHDSFELARGSLAGFIYEDLCLNLFGLACSFLLLFSQVILVGILGGLPVGLDDRLVVAVVLQHHQFYVDMYHGRVSYHDGNC